MAYAQIQARKQHKSIDARSEVETLLVARGNHIEGMKKVLNWLRE
jgi:hypothetical protein